MTQEKVEEPQTQTPDDNSPIYVERLETESSIDGQDGEDAPDLQTQLDELKGQIAEKDTRIAKQADDLRSTQGQARRQTSIDEALAGFNDRFDGMEAEMRARFKSVAAGNTETMEEEARVAREPYTNRVQATALDRMKLTGMESIDEALSDSEGNPLLDKQVAPELEQMRSLYNTGLAHANAGRSADAREQFGMAANEAMRAARVAERVQSQEQVKSIETAAKEAREKLLEDSGVEDMGTGKAGAASTPVEGAELEKGLGDGTIPMTPENQKKYQEYLDQQNFRR